MAALPFPSLFTRRGAVRAACLVVALWGLPQRASAQDLLLIPYLGFTFGGDSALFADLESGSNESASVVGGSVVLIGSGILGVEGDLAWVPGFFERDRDLVARGSSVTSLMGSAILTLPLSITRESLRPYFVGGAGLLHAEARDILSELSISSTMPAITLGGGAIGFFTNSVGVRFDLRYVRSLGSGDDLLAREGPRVEFWRGGIGLVLKY